MRAQSRVASRLEGSGHDGEGEWEPDIDPEQIGCQRRGCADFQRNHSDPSRSTLTFRSRSVWIKPWGCLRPAGGFGGILLQAKPLEVVSSKTEASRGAGRTRWGRRFDVGRYAYRDLPKRHSFSGTKTSRPRSVGH